ncbi:MAG: thioredoxin domain-containing protein [Nitrospinae bacterium]|nr:thioredoxin domain-containing protein [Nitrospinota bacterium]
MTIKKLWAEDKPALAFYALSIFGILVCLLTELEKYLPSIEAICGGPNSGCSTVRKSDYSSLFGISLGIWGIASYIVWMAVYKIRPPLAGLFGGMLMGGEIYFAYLQFSVIQAICVLCMTQFTVVLLLNVLLFATAYQSGKKTVWRLAFVAMTIVAFAGFYFPQKARAQQAVATDASITSWGNPKSDYRMEIFTDYECSHCKNFEPVVEQIMKGYPEIYIIFRDFIIQGHKLSPMATAYAGSVAYYEGKDAYIKTRMELFEKQENLFDLLKARLPMMREDKVMEKAVDEKIRKDKERADAVNISGTPTSVLTRKGETVKVIGGFLPFDEIKKDLDKLVGRPAK